MLTIEPGANQTPAANNNYTVIRADQSPQSDTGGKINASGGDTVTAASARSHFEFGQLQQINDRLNRTALHIRDDDRQMEKAGQLLSQMKQELYQIVKVYPPYPPGEPERIKFLRSFNGLRQQIDRLTFPPPDKWAGKTPGVSPPRYEAGQPAQTDIPAPVHDFAPLPAGSGNVPAPQPDFSVAELPDRASNAEIEATMHQIDKALSTVAARREQLASQAATISQAQGQDAKAAIFKESSSEAWDLALPGEKAAEQKSGVARREVAQVPASSLLGMQPQLLELLR